MPDATAASVRNVESIIVRSPFEITMASPDVLLFSTTTRSTRAVASWTVCVPVPLTTFRSVSEIDPVLRMRPHESQMSVVTSAPAPRMRTPFGTNGGEVLNEYWPGSSWIAHGSVVDGPAAVTALRAARYDAPF